jgi:hypothetical protein
MSAEAPATRFIAAAGWLGLVLFLGWQEFFIETEWRWITPWWFRVPATLMFGLVILVFALECMMQEMTVRRWATSALVFAVFGVVFLLAGVINPDKLLTARWLFFVLGVFYLGAAGAAGVGAKDSM